MNYKEQVDKIAQYFDYLSEHIANVAKAWDEMKRKCPTVINMLNESNMRDMDCRVENHDSSKYEEDEFHPYRKHFYPASGEEPDEEYYEKAWQLHISRNDHHWQFWTKYESDYPYDAYRKLLAYLEMICDWQAMGYKFGGNALQHYEAHKDEIIIDPNWKDLVEAVLTMMSRNDV